MASTAETATSPALPLSNVLPNFEFGKRKRWADLVITELVDVVLLVLSPQRKILFCGNGFKNLLRWKDTDPLDCDFAELLNAEDRDRFADAFADSLRTGDPLPPSFVRLQNTPPGTPSDAQSPASELLIELSGRPQLVQADDTNDPPLQVLFAVAKPHPNKNYETLTAFLDLHEENERLQRRVEELRARAPPSAPSSPCSVSSVSSPSQTSMYATTSMVAKRPATAPGPPEDASPSPPAQASNGAVPGPLDYLFTGTGADNEDDISLRKKKPIPKKAPPPQPAEQYACITCGRTDSPEWRKGPTGPKTLCNACGLRWAKQAKVQKLSEEAAASQQP